MLVFSHFVPTVYLGFLSAFVMIVAMISELVLTLDFEKGGEIARECGHENAIDQSTMGMRPGARMYCPDCGLTFSGIEV